MTNYPIVAVLWNDPHIVLRDKIPTNAEELLFGPTLSVGLLFQKNKDFIVIVHTLERDEEDQADYTVIFTGCIVSIQEYGQIELEESGPKGAN